MQVPVAVNKLVDLKNVDLSTVDFPDLAACPICDSSDLQELSVLEGSLTSAWCNNSSHLFHRHRPPSAWLNDWYSGKRDTNLQAMALNDDTTTRDWRTTSRFRHATRISRFARALARAHILSHTHAAELIARVFQTDHFAFTRSVLGKDPKVLDIGCGYGQHLAPFAVLGRTCGIEASQHRAAAAASLGVETANVPVEQLSVDTFHTSFDLVFSSHVLEHVADPHTFMSRIEGTIEPGGYVSIAVPNVASGWLLQDFFFGLHLHNFSRRSLIHLLQSHGFCPVKIREDFELRILAQYQPNGMARPFSSGADAQRHELQPESIFAACLGRDYRTHKDCDRYCHWSYKRRITSDLMDAEFSDAPAGARYRSLALRWSGDESLPLRFVPRNGGKGVPFWVK